jgi:uncharacterized protein YbbC (DUF1343 family)
LVWAYSNSIDKQTFFLKNHFYGRLAGTESLQKQIRDGIAIPSILDSWNIDLNKYLETRKIYLLYKDF